MARTNETRGMRDEADVGPDPSRARDLRPMHDLKSFKVADGEPDIRGWAVYTSTGREMGQVEDLLVDTDANEVVMLDVDLKRGGHHTLAPIRAAWIDRPNRRVVIDSAHLETDAGVPGLPRTGAVSDADMRDFNDRYATAYGDRGYDQDRQYRMRRGDEELRFGRASMADRPATPPTMADSALSGATGASGGTMAGHDLTGDRRTFDRERDDRDTPVRALGDDSAIDPRELDGRTRIDEGESMPPTRADSDRIVTRHARVEDDAAEVARRLHESSERHVRYPAGFERRSSDERR
jgi:sporulation protein YlmC with PRC-barrel domain